MMMIAAIDSVRSEVQFYREQSTWTNSSDDVQLRLKVEETIALGLFVFDRITRLDEQQRAEVLRGAAPHDAATEKAIEELYRSWSASCAGTLQASAGLEQRGFQVQGAEEFRLRFGEVRGILTPDHEFFSSKPLQDLRDAAIDEHRRGETIQGVVD